MYPRPSQRRWERGRKFALSGFYAALHEKISGGVRRECELPPLCFSAALSSLCYVLLNNIAVYRGISVDIRAGVLWP